MNGPKHYALAERLMIGLSPDRDIRAADIALAQVHATLALAAATALHSLPLSTDDRLAWEGTIL